MSQTLGSSYLPQARANVGITRDKIRYLAKSGTVGLGYQDLVNICQLTLEMTLDAVKADLKDAINRYVPKATGQLRENYEANLESSHVYSQALKMSIILGTNISYAGIVNRMPESSLQHSGQQRYAYYYGAHGKISLDDPEAQHDFHGLLRMILRQSLTRWFRQFLEANIIASGGKYGPVSQKASIQGMI